MEYKIEMTPLINSNTYGDTVDVTQYVDSEGIPSIIKEIDQGDFSIGVFNYQAITINFNNSSGKFNEVVLDGRSIFPLKRDKAIIEITYIDDDGNQSQSFKGIVTDRATSQDIDLQTVTLYILGLDSIFEKVNVDPGSILSGVTYSKAFEILFKNQTVSQLLNYSSANINPGIDIIIDVGSIFDNITIKEAVDELLFASGSILLIDSDDNIIVRTKAANNNTPHKLYLNDQYRRDNIEKINNFNNGLQRMFNYIIINNVLSKNQASINSHDSRSLNKTFEFITNRTKSGQIAVIILDESGVPLLEMELRVDVSVFKSMTILDKATINIKPDLTPKDGIAPLYDYEIYDEDYYPAENSEITINEKKIFKIISFEEFPDIFKAIIKLKDTGGYL